MLMVMVMMIMTRMIQIDSYSAFYDNGKFQQTELHSILQQHCIERVVVTGLALDYCVYYTSKDAHSLGQGLHLVCVRACVCVSVCGGVCISY